MFVYGGDTQDKGIGDIRFTKLLLALKQEHPDRVQLIIGNRDANKLRLAAELHADCIDDARVRTGAQFTCFTGTQKKIQILVQLCGCGWNRCSIRNSTQAFRPHTDVPPATATAQLHQYLSYIFVLYICAILMQLCGCG
jgi:hypothetical protein